MILFWFPFLPKQMCKSGDMGKASSFEEGMVGVWCRGYTSFLV